MEIAITSLGCRSNHFDSVAIINQLRKHDFRIVPFSARADFYLVNTCTVTGKADFQARRLLRRARKLNPDSRIVAIGCYPQRDPDEIARTTEADFIFGNREKKDLAVLLREQISRPSSPVIQVGSIEREKEVINFGAWRDGERSRIELKIQEGCDQECSYCVVPRTRGRPRSVPAEKLKKAVNSLEAGGYREIVFTGTQLGGYGKENRFSLAGGLQEIFREPRKARIRLSSLEPWQVKEQLLRLYQIEEGICSHLHLSVQSLDDRVLDRMRRPYSRGEVIELIRSAAETIPDLAIGLDIITGFPGEDQASFARAFSTLSDLPLAYLHIFPFSPRPGTDAAAWPGKILDREVKQRVRSLRELSRKKRQEFFSRFLGRRLELAVEEHSGKREDQGYDPGEFQGISSNYIPVRFENPGKTGDSREIIQVKVERFYPGFRPCLWGKVEW